MIPIGCGLTNRIGTSTLYATISRDPDNKVATNSPYASVGGGW